MDLTAGTGGGYFGPGPVSGNYGIDTLVRITDVIGSDFADLIKGNASNNHLFGGEGNDSIKGAEGNDTLDGGAGNDVLNGGLGDDVIRGGDGIDRVVYQPNPNLPPVFVPGAVGVTVDLRLTTAQDTGQGIDTLLGIENISASAADDMLTGTNAANVINGFWGDDLIRGLGGNDDLLGHDGLDRLLGGAGNDVLEGAAGSDRLLGGIGSDQFIFSEFMFDGLRLHTSRDLIRDFTHADDSIGVTWDRLGLSGFNDWTDAQKADTFFVVGSGVMDAEDRFIYDSVTGRLLFDPDGSGSARAAVFAVLANKPTDLDHTDFFVI